MRKGVSSPEFIDFTGFIGSRGLGNVARAWSAEDLFGFGKAEF